MDSAQEIIEQQKQRVTTSNIPDSVKEKLLEQLRFPGTGNEFNRLISYIDFVLSLPFNKLSQDILDIHRAKEVLDKNHYGLQSVKERILEYLSVLILHRKNNETTPFHAPILAFIGLVGTGKTSIAYSIAESLGRPLARIPFGGIGDAVQLRGESRMNVEAEPGQIIKAIKVAGVNNPVILLDEIDRVAESGRVDIMGVLVELLDPAQNQSFVDHYLDFPYDLSQVMFIATANNTTNIATAVLDRLEPIQMPSYSDEEKLIIAKQYLLPKALDGAGVSRDLVKFDDVVWPQVIRPLGFDAGIRSLARTLETISRKIAKKIVEGESGPFSINSENLREYLGGQ